MNLPNQSAYLILGTPRDDDSDGLSNAYELLVSHSDPEKADSSRRDARRLESALGPEPLDQQRGQLRPAVKL